MSAPADSEEQTSPIKEITQPFVDLVRAPRALWGINFGFFLEGMVYFGMLQYVVKYFMEYGGLDEVRSSWLLGVLTAGITISAALFGGLADRWGVRVALVLAFFLMAIGRSVLSAAPYLGFEPQGTMASPFVAVALGGILLVVLGYGMYQPAAYAGVRKFTSEKTAAMGYAMLYALMNLGGWLPSWFTPIRLRFGIKGTFWFLAFCTFLALIWTFVVLSRRTVEHATARAKAEREAEAKAKGSAEEEPAADVAADVAKEPKSLAEKFVHYLANHPLRDGKFAFFIFCLIPVQTLFAHNWMTLPLYVERAYKHSWPWISKNFEKAVNFNPLLIFVLVPMVTAVTRKRNVYKMIILGTFVMAAPTFFLAIGAVRWTLVAYILVMTFGEAMWQPRFLQYAAEIAPEGRTGAYMGVANFPWFLTKLIVPTYSGWFLARYCPKEGPMHSDTMWLIYGFIAISSTIILVLSKGWLAKGIKNNS